MRPEVKGKGQADVKECEGAGAVGGRRGHKFQVIEGGWK